MWDITAKWWILYGEIFLVALMLGITILKAVSSIGQRLKDDLFEIGHTLNSLNATTERIEHDIDLIIGEHLPLEDIVSPE